MMPPAFMMGKGSVMLKKFIFLLFIVCAGMAPLRAYANESVQKPSKESLLAAWEKSLKESPYTIKLEPTGEKNVYDFETSIFPYKGKLKVLNLLIDKNVDIFDDYYSSDTYKGVVETELPDISDKLAKNLYHSYTTWNRNNTFNYDSDTSKWYSHDDWMADQKRKKASDSASGGMCTQSSSDSKQRLANSDLLLILVPLLMLLGSRVWTYVFTGPDLRRRQETLQNKYIEIFESILKTQNEILVELKKK
jgi:hypothetical protein